MPEMSAVQHLETARLHTHSTEELAKLQVKLPPLKDVCKLHLMVIQLCSWSWLLFLGPQKNVVCFYKVD